MKIVIEKFLIKLYRQVKDFLPNLIKIIFKKIKDFVYPIRAVEYSFKILFLILIIITGIFIAKFSYKAFLYPIRLSQYFDECSYISMGKYFRTISPVKIYKDHIFKDKPIPDIYNEFNCRMIYWPIILSFPLKYSEDRIALHKFRAVLMAIGAIIFFLIGLKLCGVSGGIIASAFWIGTPLLNYWAHFFMTESPSLLFISAGYLFLFFADRSTFSSFFGGLFLGIAMMTRFTSVILLLPAPVILIAVYFNPFKRKSFQILGELAKSFVGLMLAILPYFIFTWWMFGNPFRPFLAAKYAVNNRLVDDPLYYVRNLWIEGGIFIRKGAVIALFSPLILALSWVFRKIIKDIKRHPIFFKIFEKHLIKKIRLRPIYKISRLFFRYLRVFIRGILFYSIIITILIVTTSIYLIVISDIPHKLPRYLMGALIPVIIISAIGLGVLEPLLLHFIRLLGTIFLSNFKKINKIKILKYVLIPVWLALVLSGILAVYKITNHIWQKTMNRPFYVWYEVDEDAVKKLRREKDITSILRLQPENVSWKQSIAERLNDVANDPEKGIDKTNYYGRFSMSILEYLNKTLKHDEVFYVDRHNLTPYTPAYAEVPCIYIDYTYNYSLYTIMSKFMPYKGYVLVSRDVNDDIWEEEGEIAVRTLNRIAIEATGRFRLVRKFGGLNLYYYNGKSFPYKFGTKDRIARIYKNDKDTKINEAKKNDKKDAKKEKSILQKLFYSWEELLNNKFKEETPPPASKEKDK